MLARPEKQQPEVEIEESNISRLMRARMIECEIAAASKANWYLIQTFPGEEMKALRWLARKGFGAFRPVQQRTKKRNGVEAGWEPVFPGWVFGFIFDMRRHRSIIDTCPGVYRVFCNPDNRPIVVADAFVQHIRARSWAYEENNERQLKRKLAHSAGRRPRLYKRQRKALEKLKKTLKESGKWDASEWANANELAPHERITLLQRAVTNSSAALAG